MNKKLKLKEAQKHINATQKGISARIDQIKDMIKILKKNLSTPHFYSSDSADKSAETTDIIKLQNNRQRITELQSLRKSPYFSKCKVQFDNENMCKPLYFSKFSYPQNNIYSWVSPASRIRFQDCGDVGYKLPNEKKRKGRLHTKDQFMIVNGKIVFMASESLGHKRTLIHQEHFTDRKKSFMLPEIVEKMEESQDAIIRIPYKGSLLISGPAGSGKTTLALHRAAYLIQSPETSKLFKPYNVIIFVQDESTRKYFTELLPDLGIKNVKITTFEKWAFKQLGLRNYSYKNNISNSEPQNDIYKSNKNAALKQLSKMNPKGDIFNQLKKIYKSHFSPEEIKLLEEQKRKRILDRYDLTALLHLFISKNGMLLKGKNSKVKISLLSKIPENETEPLQYSLIILDEAENYLPEQINIIKTCINDNTKSLLYVGDLKQQTKLFSLKGWHEVDESFKEKRHIKLPKTYRSTKPILKYIKNLGYNINISKKAETDGYVIEQMVTNKNEEISYIKKKIEKEPPEKIIGIIGKDNSYMQEFKQKFQTYNNIHVMTIEKAQGVEFEKLFMVGVNRNFFIPKPQEYNNSTTLLHKRRELNKYLIYVALSRAQKELHILGNIDLKKLLT